MPRTPSAMGSQADNRIQVAPEIKEGLRRYFRLHRMDLEAKGVMNIGQLADELLYEKLRHVMPKSGGPGA